MTDSQGTLCTFTPDQIFGNPYQHPSARRFRGDEFDALVEDIRVNGVHQPPPARPHPELPNAAQLQMGHRRLAAWRVARPGEPFAVILKPLTDLQMVEGVVEENIHRADLNDIERAQLVETYMQVRPDATNADVARVFGLKNPASITNIRKLLKLPPAIQKHVAEGALPDALARQLVGVNAVNPKAAQKIADAVAAASKSDKQDTFEEMARNLYWRDMIRLDSVWPLDWLANAPVTVEADLGDGEHVIGACGGCVFNVGGHCARRACFTEKYKLWAAAEVQRVAAGKKIAPLAPDETPVALFMGNHDDDDRASELLNARKELRAVLRIAPAVPTKHNYLQRVLGSPAVTLVTVDKAVVMAYFTERAAAAKAKPTPVSATEKDTETDAQRAKRLAAEKRIADANRAARGAKWKNYYDACWLIEHAADLIAEQLVTTLRGPFLGFVSSEFGKHYHTYGLLREVEETLEKQIEIEKEAEHLFAFDKLRLKQIALDVLSENATKRYFKAGEGEHEFEFEEAHDVIVNHCTPYAESEDHRYAEEDENFGVTLPDGWDVVPVHHTHFNCWQCGKFAGNVQPKLTKRDVDEDGWITDASDGVFCSEEHFMEYEHARAEAVLVADTRQKRGHEKNSNAKAKGPARKTGKTKAKR